MTRKHFQALAEALRQSRPEDRSTHTGPGARPTAWVQWLADREAVANVCQAANPNFDRGRFLVWTEKSA